jgi:DNA helicase-2/ATP-dependent DNA helicase PcrA
MPYKLVGATRFYARSEIKDLMAYLRIVDNLYDAISLSRILNVPRRKIGAQTQEALFTWAATKGLPCYEALGAQGPVGAVDLPVSAAARKAVLQFYQAWSTWVGLRDQISVLELLDRVIRDVEYGAYLRDGSQEGEERWENVLELRAVASEYAHLPLEEALSTFLEEVSLVSDVDNLDDADAPTLLTLHSAKGLEFGTVFIVGLNEGLLPHSRCFDDPDAMEEERRLFYVGVTRVQDRLYLAHSFRRTMYGANDLGQASRFLADVPAQLQADANERRGRADRQPTQTHLSLGRSQPGATRRLAVAPGAPFSTGEKVKHTSFGEGTVIQVQQRGEDWDVTVAFKGLGIKTLVASFANLQKAP